MRSGTGLRYRRRSGLGVAAVLTAAILSAPATAGFGAQATESHAISSGTLAAPTGLGASGACDGTLSARVTLTWIVSSSAFADGYEVLRATGSGSYSVVASVAGRATSLYVDRTTNVATTYSYRVRATRNAWRSASSSTVSVTTPVVCL